jgi:hypothetical protein
MILERNKEYTMLPLQGLLVENLCGVPGMVSAIPLLGISKIIFDHAEPLKPIARLPPCGYSRLFRPDFRSTANGC